MQLGVAVETLSKDMMATKMWMKAGEVITLPRAWFGYFDNSLIGVSEIIFGADDPELENKNLFSAKIFSKL